MNRIRAIRSDADHQVALARISALMDAEPGTPDGDELDVLADLVELYESKHVPIGYPSPAAAIRFRMEQAELSPRDLVPILGSRAKVSEILSGKRELTLKMARALHRDLGIPAESLLRESERALPATMAETTWDRFPLRAMAKLGWFADASNLADRAEELMRDLMRRAGGESALPVLYRRNDHARANAKTDGYALQAWCWQVLATARATKLPAAFAPGLVTPAFLGRVARLSWAEAGPKLAKEFLAKHGLHVVALPHLPRTHLDGAAFLLADGTPVIGLTLRHDRLDNFWFCLLHELAHVGRHMGEGGGASFIDDLSLRSVERHRHDIREREADEWAEEALVPAAAWENSETKRHPTPGAVVELAHKIEVHPAVVAGRVRHERKNYRLLANFIGGGQVRRLFGLGSER